MINNTNISFKGNFQICANNQEKKRLIDTFADGLSHREIDMFIKTAEEIKEGLNKNTPDKSNGIISFEYGIKRDEVDIYLHPLRRNITCTVEVQSGEDELTIGKSISTPKHSEFAEKDFMQLSSSIVSSGKLLFKKAKLEDWLFGTK